MEDSQCVDRDQVLFVEHSDLYRGDQREFAQLPSEEQIHALWIDHDKKLWGPNLN
ncbi:MAG: hypothetical protein KDD60_04060 [Bdellovibrionales bacterium]|nr:hypothetical protein [Bdellovibrionales bacterium]